MVYEWIAVVAPTEWLVGRSLSLANGEPSAWGNILYTNVH